MVPGMVSVSQSFLTMLENAQVREFWLQKAIYRATIPLVLIHNLLNLKVTLLTRLWVITAPFINKWCYYYPP